MIIFDTLEYTKGAEAIGIKREHAEYEAHELSYIVKQFNDDSVTKSYLSKELNLLENKISTMEERLRNEIINIENKLTIKLGSIMIAGIGILGFLLHK